jgi:hypothetical protein
MERLGFRTDLRGNDPAVPPVRSFLVAQGVWMMAVFVALHLVGAFTVENYFVACYFGFVVTAQTFAPTDRSERWWRVVRWLIRTGFLVRCYFVVMRTLSVAQL